VWIGGKRVSNRMSTTLPRTETTAPTLEGAEADGSAVTLDDELKEIFSAYIALAALLFSHK